MNARFNYWFECVEIAASECGANLTKEQIEYIADSVEGSHENYGMAFGDDVASANLAAARKREIDDAWKAAERERNKVHCRECNGRGRIIMSFGTMQSDSECWKCRGEGRHDP